MKTKLVTFIFLIIIQFSCVQKEHQKEVTFIVDVSQVENVESVGLRGQFTSPPWQVTIPLSKGEKNGSYRVSLIETTAQNQVEFKFVVNEDEFELKDQPNRIITFSYQPEEIVYEATFNNKEGKQTIIP